MIPKVYGKCEIPPVNIGEYYADFDTDTEMYCVFHTETSSAYASYASASEAEESAANMNRLNKLREDTTK